MTVDFLSNIFDRNAWGSVPFHFWSVAFFCLGSIVGSFLNVCIHRLPRGESLVSPPSHCPHCHYAIPWYLNIPLVTWLWLRGRCRHCGAGISVRYFGVELLTAVAFLGCWLGYGRQSVPVVFLYALLLSGFIVGSLIDFEHFIIPDEITIGGIVAGFAVSLLVPALHGVPTRAAALEQCFLGALAGWGLMYGILRAGKMLYGRQRYDLPPGTRVYFTETAVRLPDREVPYDDLFVRGSDAIVLQAREVELVDRGYARVAVRLSPERLTIGQDEFKPAEVHHLEVVTDKIVVPREAMGLGDVKFMTAIGAFLGWQAVVFSLMISAMIGAVVGVTLVALRRGEWSSRLPYGPYIALAATIWIFKGRDIVGWWLGFER